MPQLTLPVVRGELSLTALVNVGAQAAQDRLASGQALPPGAWLAAVVDTGTTLTCVSGAVLRQLGLTPTGQGTSQTVGGPLTVDIYRVSLSLLPPLGTPGPMLTFGDMKVLELPTPVAGVDVLVGMDVLLTCRLVVDGPARQFTLDF